MLQALEASQEAISRFDSAGTPWLRPRDYYAEMVKSDDHMARVKQQLMYEQTQLEQAEERYAPAATEIVLIALPQAAVLHRVCFLITSNSIIITLSCIATFS